MRYGSIISSLVQKTNTFSKIKEGIWK